MQPFSLANLRRPSQRSCVDQRFGVRRIGVLADPWTATMGANETAFMSVAGKVRLFSVGQKVGTNLLLYRIFM